ncbi:MAG: nitrilase-related carbon-nitrogen hydrolase, partial [Microcystaceae cyanobacterium]
MKIAIAQLNPTIGDITGNAQRLLEVSEEAYQQGAELLLTPELSLCGYPPKDLLLNPSFIGLIAQELEQLAKQIPPNLALLVGTVEFNHLAELTGGKPLFN